MNAAALLGRAGPFRGTAQIFLYNWTSYLFGALACLVAIGVIQAHPWPAPVRWVLTGGAISTAFWLISSLLVSYWVYDHSPLYRWDWIRELFPGPPARWANLHVGLDDTTSSLRRQFPETRSVVLDLYDPGEMTEPSIRRARRLTPASVPAIRAEAVALPVGDAGLDAVFLIFVAHELRHPNRRRQLFRELRRVLAPGGRLLLVEHLRDLPNFLAFGPGFFHFHSPGEWRRLIGESGFATVREFRFTPFVGIFLVEVPP